jgi:hypothetical protein
MDALEANKLCIFSILSRLHAGFKNNGDALIQALANQPIIVAVDNSDIFFQVLGTWSSAQFAICMFFPEALQFFLI